MSHQSVRVVTSMSAAPRQVVVPGDLVATAEQVATKRGVTTVTGKPRASTVIVGWIREAARKEAARLRRGGK